MRLDPTSAQAPRARREEHTTTHHGISLLDPYAWLRAENWREAMAAPDKLPADIAAHLTAENAYADTVLAPLSDLRATLFAEMKARIAEEDWSVPVEDGYHAYGSDYVAGAEHPRLVRLPRLAAEAVDADNPPSGGEVLLDANAEAEGHAYFRLGGVTHASDHARIAWSADRSGAEEFTLSIRELQTGADTVLFERVTPGAAFALDARTVFAVELDNNHRPCRVVSRAPGGERRVIYEEADPGFFVGVHRTLSGGYIVIDAHDHQTSEVRLVDALDPAQPPRLVAERIAEEEYEVHHHSDALYIRTNREARDYRIVRAPVSAPGRENWEDVVPHRPGVLIVDIIVFQDFLVRLERENALPRIVITRLADGDEHTLAFDEEAYALGMSEGAEFLTNTLRFTYSSPTTPSETWDYDMASRTRRLRKRRVVPSGHDADRYVARRVLAPARDGAGVPVTLLHHVDTPLDGTAPCLLYGYGAYGITMPASFSANALSLVDRGFVHAIAHVRGGMEKGFDWYDAGRRAAKANTFNDFLDVADHLSAERFVKPGAIVAQGGSAGGMLMGVAANRHAGRFAGIIAEVPFVDVLQTMLDETLPLTPPEWPEWGDPIRDPAAFERIRSYSPIDNVCAQDYPPILALAGVSDPRVTYWEPAKWVATLRERASGSPLVLLKTNMDAGHGGASGRFKRLEEVAMVFAFALAVTGTA